MVLSLVTPALPWSWRGQGACHRPGSRRSGGGRAVWSQAWRRLLVVPVLSLHAVLALARRRWLGGVAGLALALGLLTPAALATAGVHNTAYQHHTATRREAIT